MTDDQPGLYIHVPFCSAKCRYCDFYSLKAPQLIPTYLQALSREADGYAAEWKQPFNTLYLGGGTPTQLSENDLQNLFESTTTFSFAPDTEITIEANPENISLEKIQTLKALGVNRISLGVQSLDDHELKFLGRRHTAQQALDSVEIIKSAGMDKISLDLIYGLPGQTTKAWQRTLERIAALEPDHLSCYMLTVEQGTALYRDFETGRVTGLGEETARDLFFLTSRFLSDYGYDHYEVSNFAHGPENRSRHNCKYWFGAEYLGLGPAAHSFQNEKRWWNVRSIRRWAKKLAEGEFPFDGQEQLTQEQRRIETIFLGLRTRQGIPRKILSESHEAETLVEQWVEAGLAKPHGKRIALTLDGMVISDALAQSLTDLYYTS
jgi:oxygen-independent coproporphyrinogen-3 oxidase